MGVRVDVLPRKDAYGPAVVLSRPGLLTPTSLEYELRMGGGGRLRIDLARPSDWRRFFVSGWTPDIIALVAALVGDRATRDLDILVDHPGRHRLAVDASHAAPFMRLAVVRGLDRWLQLPLEQDLVHAEIGLATWRAARDLPVNSAVRDFLFDEALCRARRASTGVAQLLDRWMVSVQPLPPALRIAVNRLVEGYGELAALVSEPDVRLSGVVRIGRALRHVAEPFTYGRDDADHELPRDPGPDRFDGAVGLIDPRNVRARVLGLGDSPDSAEIAMSRTWFNGEDAVRIRVPAFNRRVDPELARRLMVRLVDRRSGQAHSYAALTLRAGAPTLSRRSEFECVIPLRGSNLEDLRADIFDAQYRPGEVPDATEEALLRVRRAVLALRESRSRAAYAELHGTRTYGPNQPLLAELVAAFESQTT